MNKNRRAFFVIGSEGGGTNMLAEAFVSAGCYYDQHHNSHLDDYEFEKSPDLLVFRRSLPHAGIWPDIGVLRAQLKNALYFTTLVVIMRDLYCAHRSVLRRDSNRVDLQTAFDICNAIKMIAEELIIACFVSYEGFCLDDEYRKWLFVERFGLSEPSIEIKYANPKYYESGDKT